MAVWEGVGFSFLAGSGVIDFELLRSLGPFSIREAARRAGRDVKGVHGDIHDLLDAGILDRTTEGQVVFPYDAVHLDFTLSARLRKCADFSVLWDQPRRRPRRRIGHARIRCTLDQTGPAQQLE